MRHAIPEKNISIVEKIFKIYCIFMENMIQYMWIVNPKTMTKE